MIKGTIKWFNAKKGYGFITGEDEKEYFVHYSGIIGDKFKKLYEGEKVTFDISQSPKGLSAINIVREVK